MGSRRRLLAIGQALSPTGYARVLGHILLGLSESFDVALFGVNYRGPEVDSPVRVLPNRLLGDPYGREQLPALLDRVRPSIVLIHHDAYMYAVHKPALTVHRPACKVVVYCPVDSVDDRGLSDLADADLVVAYNELGAETIANAAVAKDLAPPPMTIIGHGIDADIFRSLGSDRDSGARRAAARAQVWPHRPNLANAFIVLNANRNVARKNVAASVDGFVRFAALRRDAYLCLHMGARGPTLDVRALVERSGIGDRVLTMMGDFEDAHPRSTDAQLNLVYNACDVGLNTASSEGWGLVSFELGATGAAQVLPDHIACAPMWTGHALFLRAGPARKVASHEVERALVRLHDDVALRERLSDAAHRLATSERMSWDAIGAEWTRALMEGDLAASA